MSYKELSILTKIIIQFYVQRVKPEEAPEKLEIIKLSYKNNLFIKYDKITLEVQLILKYHKELLCAGLRCSH